MKLTEKEIAQLADDCVSNHLTKEQVNFCLQKVNITPFEIPSSDVLKTYYVNVIQYLLQKDELENWLIELTAEKIVFSKEWLKKIYKSNYRSNNQFQPTSSHNEILRSMLVPGSIGKTMDSVIEKPMTLYSIASPKSNLWTGKLLEKLSERWIPRIDFQADPTSRNLRSVKISLFRNDVLFFPNSYLNLINSPGDRSQRDFGIIVRGPNPYHEEEMFAILAGRSSLGTEAACRAFADYQAINEIRTQLGGLGINIEDHKQAFLVLVSMGRDQNHEAKLTSLKVEEVGRIEKI